MNKILSRPIAVSMIITAFVLFGIVSWLKMPQRLLPSFGETIITIEVDAPNTSPSDIEQSIVKPLEENLAIITGLKEMRAYAMPSKASIQLSFDWSVDLSQSLQEIRESINKVQMPQYAEVPKVLRFDPRQSPIIRVSLSSDSLATQELYAVVEDFLSPAMDALPGVATSLVKGAGKSELAILLDQEKMDYYALTPDQVIAKVEGATKAFPLGQIEAEKKDIFLRLDNRAINKAQLEKTIIDMRGSDYVRLGDLANIEIRESKPQTLGRLTAPIAGTKELHPRPALFLDIYKDSDANIIETAKGIKNFIERGVTTYPWAKKIDFLIVSDNSAVIEKTLDATIETAILGAGFAFLVLLLFLGKLTPAILVALSIPLSVIISFFLLGVKSIDINIMTLGGLALGIGLLVDCGIVLASSIDLIWKKFQAKIGAESSPDQMCDLLLELISKETSRVAFPLIASTLTTVVVFVPIIFVDGLAANLFHDLAWAVIISLTLSLVVALITIPTYMYSVFTRKIQNGEFINSYKNPTSQTPLKSLAKNVFMEPKALLTRQVREAMHKIGIKTKQPSLFKTLLKWLFFPFKLINFIQACASAIAIFGLLFFLRLLQTAAGAGNRLVSYIFRWRWISGDVFRSYFERLQSKSYPKLLRHALQRKGWLLPVILTLLAISAALTSELGSTLLPQIDSGKLVVSGELPKGQPIRITASTSDAIERAIAKLPYVKRINALIGIDESKRALGLTGIHQFQLEVFFESGKTMSPAAMLDALPQLPDVKLSVERPSLIQSSPSIDVIVQNEDLPVLEKDAETLTKAIAKDNRFRGLQGNKISATPEFQLEINHERMLALGLSYDQVTKALSQLLKGDTDLFLEWTNQNYPIFMRLPEEKFQSPNQVLSINLKNSAGLLISLSSFAKIVQTSSPEQILRIGGQRSHILSYYLSGVSLSDAIEVLNQKIALVDSSLSPGQPIKSSDALPSQIMVQGLSEEYQQSLNQMIFALLFSVVLVYLIMASQFESLWQPLVVMVSIPLAFIGVAICLYLFNMELNIMVGVGLIVLIGIIVNNAILLVDTFNRFDQNQTPSYTDPELLAQQGSHEQSPTLTLNETLTRTLSLKRKALVDACENRMGPIIMTTATSLLGLIPMMVLRTEGYEMRVPLAVTLFSGLLCGTLLTLFIIPMAIEASMSIRLRLLQVFKRRRRGKEMGSNNAKPLDSSEIQT